MDDLISQTATKRSFHTLDGIRGVAALTVVVFHIQRFVSPISFPNAYLAVDLFFLMSGFVIAHAYERKLRTGMSAWTFVRIRIARLYPLYFLGFSVAAIAPLVGLFEHASTFWTWRSFLAVSLPELIMLPGPPIDGKQPFLFTLNFPAWSLFFEIMVNLAYPFLLRSNKVIWSTLIGASGFGIVTAVFVMHQLDGGWLWGNAEFGLARVIYSFLLGVVVWRLHTARMAPRLKLPAWMIIFIILVLLWISTNPDFRPVYDALCVLVVFPILLVAAVENEPAEGIKVFSFLGLVSYPIYVLHTPVATYVDRFAWHYHTTNIWRWAPVSGIAIVIGLIIVSWAAATLYDPPARYFAARFLGVKQSPVP